MSFIRKYFFLLCFFAVAIAMAQSIELDELSNVKKQTNIIDELIQKELFGTLSNNEYITLSMAYSKVNKEQSSLLILNKIIPKLLTSNNIDSLFIAYTLKSRNLMNLDKIDEGINFCDEILHKLEGRNPPYLQLFYLNCGMLYNRGKQYQKAYDIYQKITNDAIKLGPTFVTTYGHILANLQKNEEAIFYLKKGIDLRYKSNELATLNVAFRSIGKVLINEEKWEEAKIYLDSSYVALQESDKQVYHKKDLLKTYYYYFVLQNKLAQGRMALYEIENYNNRIYNFRVKQKLKELSEINERKNILNKKVLITGQKIKKANQNWLLALVILISIAIIILSVIFLVIYRNTNLKYQKILNEQELLSSQMTPHFIFNCLSILQGMILNKEHKKASTYLSKFSNILKFIVREQTNKFTPLHEEILSLKDYVDIQNLSTKKDIDFNITIEKSLQELLSIPSMILQPFIENAIIHGFKEDIESPMIHLTFMLQEKILYCTISDNGIGLIAGEKKETNKKSSLAIKIVKDRFAILSKKMNRKFSVTIEDLNGSKGRQGTEVSLKLPYMLKKQYI